MRTCALLLLAASSIVGLLGCDPPTGGGGGACPDPSDPGVHYVSQDPDECALIDFVCAEGQTLMTEPGCGCGCIDGESPPPACPDPGEPGVRYVSHEPNECALIDFDCSPPEELFSSECGCGCLGPAPETCPDDADPDVRYVSHDPEYCHLVDFICGPGEALFSDECGCGCVGPALPVGRARQGK